MKLKIMAWVLIITLLVACTPANDPAYPGQGVSNPAEGGPYPGSDSDQPVGPEPYPGGDEPVSSDGPVPGSPYPDPRTPIPGEEDMNRGEVFIDQSDILILESYPPQFVLHIVGSLPTPCHHLRAVVSEPNEQKQIQIEVYSLVDPDEICAQMLEPFDSRIPLGSYEPGKYTVIVNGVSVGEIDA